MLEGTAMINCDQNTYVLEPDDMILFLPQQIHSIYSTTNIPLKYYVLKFDINQLSPSANAPGHTLSGIHFNSLFRCAKGDAHAPLYFSAETLEGIPIETLFEKCYSEMKEQEAVVTATIKLQFRISGRLYVDWGCGIQIVGGMRYA